MVIDIPSASSPHDEEDDTFPLQQRQPYDTLSTHPSTLTSRLISLVGVAPDDAMDTKPLKRLHTPQLLQMILQDAQTRLFFKAQSIVQADIRYFVPKEADLAYPAKLIGESQNLCPLALRR